MDTNQLAPTVERHVLWHLVLTAEFSVHLDLLEDTYFSCDVTKRLGRILKKHGAKYHRVPGSFEVMFQLIEREVDEGASTIAVRDELESWVYTNLLLDFMPIEPNGVNAALTDVIKAHRQFMVLDRAVKVAGKRGNIRKFAEELIAIDEHGEAKEAPPQIVTGLDGMVEFLNEAPDLQRLSTCSYHLDNIIDGGLPIRTIGLLMASSGVGKSMLLSNLTCASIVQEVNTVLCVTEDTMREPVTRMLSWLSGLTQEEIRKDKEGLTGRLVRERWGTLGTFDIIRFDSTGSLAKDIVDQITAREDKLGVGFKMKIVDYLDPIEGVSKIKASQNTYEKYKDIMRFFHDYVDRTDSYMWTATQAKRLMKAIKKELDQDLDLNDGADSQHKVRTADIVIALNVMSGPKGAVVDGAFLPKKDEDVYIQAHCLKHRQGKKGRRSETVLADLDRAVLLPDPRYNRPYTGDEVDYESGFN